MDSFVNNQQCFCTIIAKNYLGYARVLVQSLKLHHPNLPCFVLIVDEVIDEFAPQNEEFTLISIDKLNIPNIKAFTFKYNITELSTAVKPYLLEYLIKAYVLEKIIYLDPDIYVFKPLDYIFELLDRYSIILTPHITKALPNDGLLIDEQNLLLSGVYNLGFIAITNTSSSSSLLSWWQDKLYDQCIIDHANALFVDQRWVDLVPAIFNEVYLLKEPGYNVAYWNLHERSLSYQEEVWYCNQKLLYFFHFSGIVLSEINTISKYQNRYSLINKPELKPLFESYRESLLINQQQEISQWKYGYGYYSDGTVIENQERKFYYYLGPTRHNQFPNPFDAEVTNSFKSQIGRVKPLLRLKAKLKSLIPKILLSNLKTWLRSPRYQKE